MREEALDVRPMHTGVLDRRIPRALSHTTSISPFSPPPLPCLTPTDKRTDKQKGPGTGKRTRPRPPYTNQPRSDSESVPISRRAGEGRQMLARNVRGMAAWLECARASHLQFLVGRL